LATGMPQPAMTKAEAVEMLTMGAVAAGADDVDRACRRRDGQHLVAHGGDGAGNLLDRLAAHPKAHQKGADLARRRLAGHDDVEGRTRFREAQLLARGDLGDVALQVAHRS